MKTYFSELDEERAYQLPKIIKEMKDQGLKEVKIWNAVRETGTDYFYCKEYDEVGEKGETCGKWCEGYKPRNGKNGRCIHSGYCYYHGKQYKLTVNGKIKRTES